MQRRFWQTATVGVAVGMLGMGAWAQWDIDEPADEADEPAGQQQADPPAFGEPAAADDDALTVGTVDLVLASEAYERLEQAREQAGGEAGADEFGDDAALPRQGDAAGAEGEAPIDPEMIDEVRDTAREAAEARDVDLVVLEVLHDEQSGVQQTDLTAEVIVALDERAAEAHVDGQDADDAEPAWDAPAQPAEEEVEDDAADDDDWGDITW